MKTLLKYILYQPLFNLLIFFAFLVPGHSIGWAIVILTIIIRLLLYPSSQKAVIAQRRLRDLAPELEKLKEKYKDDRQAFARAQMEFYKEKGVNPFGGCLPLLLQFPILIILYYVFRAGLDASHYDYLYSFTPRPEYTNTFFFGIDLAKPDKYILPLLTGIGQFIQARQMMPAGQKSKIRNHKSQSDDLQKMMSTQMVYLMPLMTVFIARSLPAALPLYWLVTTIFSIAQQKYVNQLKILPAGTIAKKGVEVSVRQKS